jgi:phage-related minor tail protein
MDAGPTTSSAQITANAADVNSAGLGAFAKGGAFEGSSSLSAHSNSIVDSPTLFAFAKGGVPNRGVAGEAGPEAILPLKRDAQGNLGIRGGGGGDTNNIAININIQEGQASEDSSSGDQNAAKAKELGILIKAVVGQELIKQSRPGGLLAK